MLHHKNTSIFITSSSSPVMKCQHKNTPDYPDCRESGTDCFSIRQPEKLEPPWQEFLMIIQTIPFVCTGSTHYTEKGISYQNIIHILCQKHLFQDHFENSTPLAFRCQQCNDGKRPHYTQWPRYQFCTPNLPCRIPQAVLNNRTADYKWNYFTHNY